MRRASYLYPHAVCIYAREDAYHNGIFRRSSAPVTRYFSNTCLRESSMGSLCCMSFLGKDSSELLVAGCQSTMYKIDVEKGIVLQEVDL